MARGLDSDSMIFQMSELHSNSLTSDHRFSSSLIRGLRVLELVAATSKGATVGELIEQLPLGRGTTYRLVRTLEKAGWIRRGSGGRYVIAGVAVQVAAQALEAFDVRAIAHGVLVSVRDQCGETVHLGVLQDRRVMYLDKVDTPHVLRMHTQVGSVMPVHSTALGKALLAYSPPSVVDRVLTGELERRTAQTVTSAGELRKQLAVIRETGIAVDDIENEPEIRCVGAAIFNHDGSVIAAMSISAPASRFTPNLIPEYGRLVRDGALQVSRLLGGGDAHAAFQRAQEDSMATRNGGSSARSFEEVKDK